MGPVWQEYSKLCPPAPPWTFGLYFPLMNPDNMAYHIETKTTALSRGPARPSDPIKLFKYLLGITFFKADAVIGKTELQGVTMERKGDIHLRSLSLIVLDRIGQQIGEQYFKEGQVDPIRE